MPFLFVTWVDEGSLLLFAFMEWTARREMCKVGGDLEDRKGLTPVAFCLV